MRREGEEQAQGLLAVRNRTWLASEQASRCLNGRIVVVADNHPLSHNLLQINKWESDDKVCFFFGRILAIWGPQSGSSPSQIARQLINYQRGRASICWRSQSKCRSWCAKLELPSQFSLWSRFSRVFLSDERDEEKDAIGIFSHNCDHFVYVYSNDHLSVHSGCVLTNLSVRKNLFWAILSTFCRCRSVPLAGRTC